MLDGTADLAWFHGSYIDPPVYHGRSLQEEQRLALSALAALKPERADDYSEWVMVGMILHALGLGVEVWDRWSQKSSKYVAGECARRWASFNPDGGLGLGTLILMAQEDGWSRSEPPAEMEFESITCTELLNGDYTLEYLIEGLLVAGQPLIIAGPQKVLKTSIMVGAALALAVGGLFLGRFKVLRPCRVAVMTGESGFATIRETAMRICAAMGLHLDEITNIFWSKQVPRFGSEAHLAALDRLLIHRQVEVLFIDPAYMAVPGGDAGNLMIQGELLGGVNEICQRHGVTMVLVHHTKKHIDPKGPPGLEDISWAGFGEFARQWWLIGRREKYTPGTGEHKLWLSGGGSAGHSALWAVNVEEGVQEDAGGRRWSVTVQSPDEAAAAVSTAKKDEKNAANQAKLFEAAARAEALLREHPDGLSKTRIRDLAHIGRQNDEAVKLLLAQGRIEPCQVLVSNKNTPIDGYRLPAHRAR